MRTTCLITNFCYGRFVTEAINSALGQTRPFDEIIVVDDGSTDGSPELIRKTFGANHQIKLIEKENGGQLSCLNAGIQAASGDVVFFLDADDHYSSTMVDEVMRIYESGRADFVMTGLKQFGGADLERGPATSRDLGYTRLYSFFFEKWLGAPTSCISCRRDLLSRFIPLPFAADWRTRADDCLSFGASLCGGRKYQLARPLVNYRVHGSNNYYGKRTDPALIYRHSVAVQRLIQHIARAEGLDVTSMAHLAAYEFATNPSPTYVELRHYLRILFQGERLSPVRKLRYATRMVRHFLSQWRSRAHGEELASGWDYDSKGSRQDRRDQLPLSVNDRSGKNVSPPVRFVIACEVIDNVRLMQPHGMIPYTLHKHYGYDSEVICFRNGEYTYPENELRGLKLHFLRHLVSRKAKLPFFWYLARNAKNIDVLMVYNVKKRPIYYGLIYKLFNPRGFLYAKADTALSEFNFYVANAFFPYKLYMRMLGKLFLDKCDAVSFESSRPFRENMQVPERKKLLIPCGFDPDIVSGLGVRERTFAEKEDIVLHVSRMGTYQKNTEHLIRSIPRMNIPENWRFVFVGSQTPSFRRFRDDFVNAHPEFMDRLEFHDHVSDKAQLYDFYNRAKIFCLPSRIESFGNVLVEALYFGNVIAATGSIPSVQDLVDDGRNGITFDIEQDDDLARKLEALIADPLRMETLSDSARDYARSRLVWKDILEPLHTAIRTHYAREA